MSRANMAPARKAARGGGALAGSARAITASRGAARARRQKPAAAGPVSLKRTKIGARPITTAPNSRAARALARDSAKAQVSPERLRRDAPRPDLSQGLGLVA